MNNNQFDYRARKCPAQSNCYLNLLSALVISIHHSHHHEHPAQ